MAPIELTLSANARLSIRRPRSETSALNPQLEALETLIQTPIKAAAAGTHFTDTEGMEGSGLTGAGF